MAPVNANTRLKFLFAKRAQPLLTRSLLPSLINLSWFLRHVLVATDSFPTRNYACYMTGVGAETCRRTLMHHAFTRCCGPASFRAW